MKTTAKNAANARTVICLLLAALLLLGSACRSTSEPPESTAGPKKSPAASDSSAVLTDPTETPAAPATEAPTPTEAPTATPEPTPTPTEVPTATPEPTPTPTEVPTATPEPTATPTPTYAWQEFPSEIPDVKYSDMEYRRPDAGALAAKLTAAANDVREQNKSREALLDELGTLFYVDVNEWSSMYSLAYIKFAINTQDEKWNDEVSFFDRENPELERAAEKVYVACAQSPDKAFWERELFGEGELDEYVNGPLISETMAELMQREAELVTQFEAYDYMQTVFEVRGYSGTLETIAAQIARVGHYELYDELYENFYKKVNSDTGAIFVELLKLRHRIAAEAGYDDYEQYVYDHVLYRDYSPADALKLATGIRDKLVPYISNELTGDDAFMNALYAYENGLPELSYGQLTEYAEKVLPLMDASLSEVFGYLDDNELCYLGYSSEQAGMSFTTYIPKYYAPFIVIGGSGDTSDLITFVHEFGHFYDNYFNFGQNNNLDMSEISSTALSYLFACYLDGADIPARQKAAYRVWMKYTMLETFVTQAMYHMFEQRAYKLGTDEISLAALNAIAADVAREFDMEDEYFDLSWALINHFYLQPFYVVSYVTSNAAAVQLYNNEVNDPGAGLAQYLELINPWDLTRGFTANIRRVGIKSPFSASAADDLLEAVRKMLQ